MTIRLFLPMFLCLLTGTAIQAQYNPVTWTFEAENKGEQLYAVHASATVEEGWYVYSQFLDDAGPVPTELSFDQEDVTPQGKAVETGKKVSGYDEIFGMDIVKFKEEATFTQEVQVAAGLKQVAGGVTFMVCNDEQCLPPRRVAFTINLQ